MLEVGYLFECLFLYLVITDESQGDRFLSIQDAKHAVDLVYIKNTQELEKEVNSLLP